MSISNGTSPSVLLPELSQLASQLNSAIEQERYNVTSILTKMFSEKDSNRVHSHNVLWPYLVCQFNDESIRIRMKCVECTKDILINYPELCQNVIEMLRLRSFDRDVNIRYAVVLAIISTLRQNFLKPIAFNEELLLLLGECMSDKEYKIKEIAATGLASIYNKYLNNPNISQATKRTFMWVNNKILHSYYGTCIEEKLLVERLVGNLLVPNYLPSDKRVKRLYILFDTIDDDAKKAFKDILKTQLLIRSHLEEFIDNHKKEASPLKDKEIQTSIKLVSRYLPEPVKAVEVIAKFSQQLTEDSSLLNDMDKITKQNYNTVQIIKDSRDVLSKICGEQRDNFFYNTVRTLLERVSSVLINDQILMILVNYVKFCLDGAHTFEVLELHSATAGYSGLELLNVLSNAFGYHFYNLDILMKLTIIWKHNEDYASQILSILNKIGKYKTIDSFFQFNENVIHKCKKLAVIGTPKEAKEAIQYLYINVYKSNNDVFDVIVEQTKMNLKEKSNKYYETAIVALGHLATNVSEKYEVYIKDMISKYIVNELLDWQVEVPTEREVLNASNWCSKDVLPKITKCRVEGIKTVVRWLIGLKDDKVSSCYFPKTFKLLIDILVRYHNHSGILSESELAWLRLQAGCSMLKVCEYNRIAYEYYTIEQFFVLSRLMMDKVLQVREIFAEKLHKGLGKDLPFKCLPLYFMGMYTLAGMEENKRLKSKIYFYILEDINRRREYARNPEGSIKDFMERAAPHIPSNILPEFVLSSAIKILTHSLAYKTPRFEENIKMILECVWFIMKPLVMNNDFYNLEFYNLMSKLIGDMHNQYAEPNDHVVNEKLRILCVLAKSGLLSMITTNILNTSTLNHTLDDEMEEVIDEKDSTMVDMSVESNEEDDE